MATFGDMQQDVSLLVSGRVAGPDIAALLNRAQQQIAEAYDWSFLRTNVVLNSILPKQLGTITVSNTNASVLGNGTAFTAADVGSFLWVGGLNIPPIPIQSVQGAQALTLVTPWPGPTQIGSGYVLAPLYYRVPNSLQIRSVRSNEELTYVQRAWLNENDPARVAQGGAPSLYWTDAPPSADGNLQIELWPVPGDARPYLSDIKQKPPLMVALTDLPLMPYAVVENKALAAACMVMYASTGQQSWLSLADHYQALFESEFEAAQQADRQRMQDRSQVNAPDTGAIYNDSLFVPLHDIEG